MENVITNVQHVLLLVLIVKLVKDRIETKVMVVSVVKDIMKMLLSSVYNVIKTVRHVLDLLTTVILVN